MIAAMRSLIGLCVLGALALSAQAGPKDGKTPAGPAAFDLSYLSPDAMGALAMRPAAIFGRPELKKVTEQINTLLRASLVMQGITGKVHLRVEDVEQFIGPAVMGTDPRKKDPQSYLVFGVNMVRTVAPFDWQKQMAELCPKSKAVRYAGKTYYKLSTGDGKEDEKGAPCYWVADERTIVGDTEENLRLLLGRASRPKARPWAPAWKQVEHGLLAFVLDNGSGLWLHEEVKRREPTPQFRTLLESLDWMVLGVGEDAGVVVDATCGSKDGAAARKVLHVLKEVLADAKKELTEHESDAKKPHEADVCDRALEQMAQSATLRRDGAEVRFHGAAKGNFTGLLLGMIGGESVLSCEASAGKAKQK